MEYLLGAIIGFVFLYVMARVLSASDDRILGDGLDGELQAAE